jgi:GLPGLI family protein
MKKILFVLILLGPSVIWAQQSFEGRIRYLMTQNWPKIYASVPYISKQSRDRVSYMWGNEEEWKMFYNLHFNQNISKYEVSEEKPDQKEEDTWASRKQLFFMKRDFTANTMSDAMQFLGKDYLIEDAIPPIDWKIQNDLKEVAGHICMKAFTEDTMKNQKIVAWFAQDIPLSAGPDRYSGLPGLILEIDINDGAMLLTADKIDLKKLTVELDLPKKIKSKKIKNADYQDLVKKHFAEKRKEESFPFWGIRY